MAQVDLHFIICTFFFCRRNVILIYFVRLVARCLELSWVALSTSRTYVGPSYDLGEKNEMITFGWPRFASKKFSSPTFSLLVRFLFSAGSGIRLIFETV